MNRIIVLALLVTLIVVAAIMSWFVFSGQLLGQKGFGVYLSGNGELVFSDKDIEFYNWTSHHIKLNEKGIEGIKKLDLYHKSFVVKLNGKEMYKGYFWSYIDSMSYSVIDFTKIASTIWFIAGLL